MAPSEDSGNAGALKLAAVDEILQVMYWLRGEQLAADVTAAGLARWVGLDTEGIEPLLERLAASGLLQPAGEGAADGPARYALTECGVREGGRRFADEFAELTRPGHYECTDPNCECQRSGDLADCLHRHPGREGGTP
jgi:hypothetical protein